MLQLLSLSGAALLLAAFGLSQTGKMSNHGAWYAFLNCSGSLLIMVTAIQPLNAGVVVLECAWALISARSWYIALKTNRSQKHQTP
jgi:hypothetical protein